MAEYTFHYSDAAAVQPKAGGLLTELRYVLGEQLILGVDSNDATSSLLIRTSIELDATGQGAMAAIVSSHQGITYPTPILKGSSKLVQEIQPVKTETDWFELAGVLAKPSMLVKDLANMVGEVNGQYRSMGEGAELQVCETREDTSHVELSTVTLAPTNEVWTPFSIQMTTDQEGLNLYELKARKNQAKTLSLRFVSLYLFELL